MNERCEPHVVFGGSGGAGSAIVCELTEQGKRVRVVTRSGRGDVPDSVEVVRAGAAERVGARSACVEAAVRPRR